MYIETTIPSYATANSSGDVIRAGRQELTRLFWENARQGYDLFISQFVLDECAKGDPDAARRRLDFIAGIATAEITEGVAKLAPIYQELLKIPEKAKADSFHLAVCVDAKINYLLTWNYKHLSVESYKKLLEYNTKNGLPTPFLVTPETLNKKEQL